MKQTVKYSLIGESPLLMHNGQLADPLNEWTKAIAKVTAKKKRTEADHQEISRLEWFGGLYLTDGRPCIPLTAIKATLLRAAMKLRKGPQAKSGLVCEQHAILEYDGPTDPKALWEDGHFSYRTTKAQQGKRIVRTRPMFYPWSTTIALAFDDEALNPTDIDEIVAIGGRSIGFLDERPEYGRYQSKRL